MLYHIQKARIHTGLLYMVLANEFNSKRICSFEYKIINLMAVWYNYNFK